MCIKKYGEDNKTTQQQEAHNARTTIKTLARTPGTLLLLKKKKKEKETDVVVINISL